MWSSADFRALSAAAPNGQTLWLWLLSCERTIAIPGVVVARIAVIADDLRWPVRATRKILLEQIVASGMAEVDEEAGLVVLTKALLVDGDVRDTARPTSINQGKSWGTAFAALPRCALRDRLGDRLVEFFRRVGGEIANAFAETSCLPSARQGACPPQAKSDGKAQGERTQESETESEDPEISLSACARDGVAAGQSPAVDPPPPPRRDPALALAAGFRAQVDTARVELQRELGAPFPGGSYADRKTDADIDATALGLVQAWCASAPDRDPAAVVGERAAHLIAIRAAIARHRRDVGWWAPGNFWRADGIGRDLDYRTPEEAIAALTRGRPGHGARDSPPGTGYGRPAATHGIGEIDPRTIRPRPRP